MIGELIEELESALESVALLNWRQFASEVECLTHGSAAAVEPDTFTVTVEGVTIAVRRDPWRQQVGLFADLGLLPAQDTAAALRSLLALNGNRDYAPARFGVHAGSQRAVAALNFPLALLAGDRATGLNFLARLSRVARLVGMPR